MIIAISVLGIDLVSVELGRTRPRFTLAEQPRAVEEHVSNTGGTGDLAGPTPEPDTCVGFGFGPTATVTPSEASQ